MQGGSIGLADTLPVSGLDKALEAGSPLNAGQRGRCGAEYGEPQRAAVQAQGGGELVHAALTFVRSIASQYNIPSDFYQKKDIHIHVPEGAVPKDGPSAGVTMTTALVSALAGIPVRRDIAMTGEVPLRGNVLAIGGLKEKTMAAYAAGITTVCIPADNMGDLDEIDPIVRENLTFIPCRRASDVLAAALVLPTVCDTAAPVIEIPEGSKDNPQDLAEGKNKVTLPSYGSHYFDYAATEDGTVTVTVSGAVILPHFCAS